MKTRRRFIWKNGNIKFKTKELCIFAISYKLLVCIGLNSWRHVAANVNVCENFVRTSVCIFGKRMTKDFGETQNERQSTSDSVNDLYCLCILHYFIASFLSSIFFIKFYYLLLVSRCIDLTHLYLLSLRIHFRIESRFINENIAFKDSLISERTYVSYVGVSRYTIRDTYIYIYLRVKFFCTLSLSFLFPLFCRVLSYNHSESSSSFFSV